MTLYSKMNKNKINIENKFFDLVGFIFSIFNTFIKSIILLISKKSFKIKTIFFDFFDFIFRLWPRYFWKKPTFYKIWRFLKDLLDFLFYRK